MAIEAGTKSDIKLTQLQSPNSLVLQTVTGRKNIAGAMLVAGSFAGLMNSLISRVVI